jgi:protein-S-isoprenylcysteine O-methyltransferase Ste14
MTPTAKTGLVLLGTLGYLVLTVGGRGGVAAYVAVPALVALAGVLVVAGIVAPFVGGSLSPGIREDRGNRWVLIPFGVIGLLTAFLPAWADRHGIWPLDGAPIRWLGVLLFAAGTALRLWPVHVLGHRFSGLVAIQPDHRLVTTGLYGVIRHPSYLGLLIGTLGWGVAFNTWVGVLLTVALLPPLVARMNAEERLLQDQFGTDYAAYRARTWRLLPGLY